MTPAEIRDEIAAIQARADELVARIVADVPTPPVTLRRARELYEHRVRTLRDATLSLATALDAIPGRAEKLALTPTEDRRVA